MYASNANSQADHPSQPAALATRLARVSLAEVDANAALFSGVFCVGGSITSSAPPRATGSQKSQIEFAGKVSA
jgi:hypothetical protein